MRRLIALLGLAWCLGPSVMAMSAEAPAAPPTPLAGLSAEARGRFVAALGAFESGDWGTAANEFGDRSWASTPLSEYACLFQAESLLRTGDVAAARPLALRAADTTPESPLPPSALLRAAMVLSSAADEAGAATLFRRFLAHHGDHPEAARARLALAQVLLADGRTTDAARVLNDLWILAPAAPEAESAARQLRMLADRGLAGPPPATRERVERAERLLTAGLGEPAQNEAEALLRDTLAPDLRGRALRIVLEVSRRAGRYDAAKATVTRALSSLPPERRRPWLLELARLQKRQSRDLALATLDKLAREYPKSQEAAEALLQKGRLLEEASRVPEAQVVYQQLAGGYPDEAEAGAALWRLGWLAWFRGAHAEAAASWTRILAIRGGQTYREATVYWLGRADQLRGEAELASQRFARLQGDAPRSYYGILAAQRSGRQAPMSPSSPPPALPADPLEPLQADAGYARVEALRGVGLGSFADEEMVEMTRRALGDSKLLYALSAAYVQASRYHLALRILRRHFHSLARTGVDTPRAFWELVYPIGWRSELTEAASRAAIDPLLVAAVVREESSFYPQARSRVGARGLMQLMPETARPLAQARRLALNNAELLDDPATNLELGSVYLAGLLREFGDARLAVAAYNAGPARVREWWGTRRSDDLEVWVEQIPFDETRAFVRRVMLSWDEYRRLYGPAAAVEPAAVQEGSSWR
jgi:soluble lytic murein transglycosylase